MGQHYRHFDLDERFELYRLIEAGLAQKEIAELIERTESTISREIRRKSLPKGGYKPASVDRIALSRRRRQSMLMKRYIYRPQIHGEKLYKYLPRSKAKRGRRYYKCRRDPLPSKRSIHERADHIQLRKEFGR